MSKYDITPPNNPQPEDAVDESLIVKYPKERNIIDDTNAEIQMLKKAFRTPLDNEREKKEANINPDFFFSVYFQNQAQKDNFLKSIGADAISKGLFINGIEFAKLLGIEIQRENIEPPKKFKTFAKKD